MEIKNRNMGIYQRVRKYLGFETKPVGVPRNKVRYDKSVNSSLLKRIWEQESFVVLRRGILHGFGFMIGMFGTGVMAVAVSGTIKTWSPNDKLSANDLNTAFTSLKTAITNIPDWTKNGTIAYYTVGSVGIGTSSPEDKLTVTDGNIRAKKVNSGTGVLRFGPGTIDGYLFHRFLNGNSVNASDHTTSLCHNCFVTNDSSSTYIANNPYSDSLELLMRHGDGWRFRRAPATFNSFSDGAFTEIMRIGSNGNVGIGTTSPGTRLDVAGDVKGTSVLVRADQGTGGYATRIFLSSSGSCGSTASFQQIGSIAGIGALCWGGVVY